MSTATMEVLENHAQEFIDDTLRRFPGIQIDQNFIDSVVGELQAVGLYTNMISLKTFKMGLASAVDAGKIILPPKPVIDIEAAARKIAAQFPPVIKYRDRELSQKEKSALAGITPQSGRATKEDRELENKKIDRRHAEERSSRELIRLRAEYKLAKSSAETICVGTHGQNATARKEALRVLANNKKFDSVREN